MTSQEEIIKEIDSTINDNLNDFTEMIVFSDGTKILKKSEDGKLIKLNPKSLAKENG